MPLCSIIVPLTHLSDTQSSERLCIKGGMTDEEETHVFIEVAKQKHACTINTR